MEVSRQVSVQDHRVTKRALLGDLLELQCKWVEARPQRLHEEKLLLLGQLEQRLELCCVGRGRLLAQDVLAVEQRVPGILVVERVRCAYAFGQTIRPTVNKCPISPM